MGTLQSEIQAALTAVTQQVNRAPTIRNEEQQLAITERIYPGTIDEHRRQQRRNQAAFEPILARF